MKKSYVLISVLSIFALTSLTWCDSPDKVHLGDTVTVQYTATFSDTTPFLSSGVSFRVWSGQVIAGLEQGVLGMKAGGKKTITITPDLGYKSLYSAMNVQKISKFLFDKIAGHQTGELITLWSLVGKIKWQETDGSGIVMVLFDTNPRETWDSLIYKIDLISKQ